MIWVSKGQVNEEMVVTLAQKINELQEDEKLYWYLCSSGGETHIGLEIIDIVNRNKEKMELIASEDIHSTAFLIFFKSQCERNIIPFTTGIMHCCTTAYDVKYGAKIAYYEKSRKENFLEVNEYLYNFCKDLGFTEKELKLFKKSEDICFDTKALHNLLEKSKELNANLINS